MMDFWNEDDFLREEEEMAKELGTEHRGQDDAEEMMEGFLDDPDFGPKTQPTSATKEEDLFLPDVPFRQDDPLLDFAFTEEPTPAPAPAASSSAVFAALNEVPSSSSNKRLDNDVNYVTAISRLLGKLPQNITNLQEVFRLNDKVFSGKI